MIANTFVINQSTVSKVTLEACTSITKWLGPNWRRNEIIVSQAFGAVEGTHIPIQKFAENSQYFLFIVKGFFGYEFRQLLQIITLITHGQVHGVIQK